MTQQTSTAVKAAALIMVAPALLFPIKAAGQQVAANATGGPNLAACDQIKDPAKSAQCSHDAVIRDLRERNAAALQRQREADARAASADAEVACGERIKAEVRAGRIAPEALRTTLAGRKPRDVGICNLLGALTRS